jgi:pimeloyl-ACP methyl ester carboxylesterase
MLRRLEDFGGSGQAVVFAHANGYPVGSYRQFISCLTAHAAVTGFHQRPLWSEEAAPDRLNWSCFVDDLIETLEATQDGPVWMMGHSMGGAVATLAAAKRPQLFRGLIMIDPLYVLTRRFVAQKITPRRKLDETALVRKTLTRPARFASEQQAFDFYRPKRVFTHFSDEVLWDYVRAGTRSGEDGELQLSYSREWEAAAYRSTPFIWGAVNKVRLPVLGLRGETSNTLTEKAFQRWHRLQPQADLRNCRGGHLLPLEYPRQTAQHVIEFLAGQGA